MKAKMHSIFKAKFTSSNIESPFLKNLYPYNLSVMMLPLFTRRECRFTVYDRTMPKATNTIASAFTIITSSVNRYGVSFE